MEYEDIARFFAEGLSVENDEEGIFVTAEKAMEEYGHSAEDVLYALIEAIADADASAEEMGDDDDDGDDEDET